MGEAGAVEGWLWQSSGLVWPWLRRQPEWRGLGWLVWHGQRGLMVAYLDLSLGTLVRRRSPGAFTPPTPGGRGRGPGRMPFVRQQYLARVFGMPQPSISRIESYWPAGDWPNLLSQKVVKSSGVAGIDEKYVLVPKRRPELVEGNEKPAGDMRRWMYVYLAVLELAGYDVSQVHKASLCAGLSVAWSLEAAQNLVPNS